MKTSVFQPVRILYDGKLSYMFCLEQKNGTLQLLHATGSNQPASKGTIGTILFRIKNCSCFVRIWHCACKENQDLFYIISIWKIKEQCRYHRKHKKIDFIAKWEMVYHEMLAISNLNRSLACIISKNTKMNTKIFLFFC